MKKRIIGLTMAILMAALSGCSTKKPLEEIVFTYVTAPLNVPTIVERERHIFEKAFADMGVSVSYAELTSGADQTQALASGDVQVLYAVGATSVILSAANGADIRVLNMYSRSPKAFSMYTKEETLSSPEALRGKTIAGPAGTNLHELLAAYLATANMSMDDVNFINMSIPEAKAALDGGSIDAALLAGATAYTAKEQGYFMIADGEGLIDAIIAVAVTEEFYRKHPQLIEELEDAQDDIEDFMEDHAAETRHIVAEALDLEPQAVEEMISHYDFSTDLRKSDIAGFQRTADFMYTYGMIDEPLDVTDLFLEFDD